jgi:hypothetical protein
MLGFKSFESAQGTLAGIEMVRMIKKGQMAFPLSKQLQNFLFSSGIIIRLQSDFLFSILHATVPI